MRRTLEKVIISKDDDRDRKDSPRLGEYHPEEQAAWARERLLGESRPMACREDEEAEGEESRARRCQGAAWSASTLVGIDCATVDQLEETMRTRLGLLSSQLGSSPRGARALFAECDGARSGRVERSAFIEAMARKLNYDFPSRGHLPSSREALAALYDRYDIDRSGWMPAEHLESALRGTTAAARATRFLGRMREGLVRHGGGLDTLAKAKARWAKLEAEGSDGCVGRERFEAGVGRLAEQARMDCTAADVNALLATFEPPAKTGDEDEGDAASGPLVSYEQFVLAARGPPMRYERQVLVRKAYAALKDDGNNVVRPREMARRYDVSEHPAVRNGSLDAEEAAMAFLCAWESRLGAKVSLAEFADRYEYVSPLFDSTSRFEAMMRAAWKIK